MRKFEKKGNTFNKTKKWHFNVSKGVLSTLVIHVHMCVRCVQACSHVRLGIHVCVRVCIAPKLKLGVLLNHSPRHILRHGLSLNPGAHRFWVACWKALPESAF